ncbi:MAG TPA: alpha-L-fucosidase, partial [Lachnospiraceae bacterium]|nr:alpha-L-fucosidase [Lachnospiraceae bacterium]
YKKDGIAFTRKDNFVYAIQVFTDEKETISSDVFLPYVGEVTEIIMLDSEDKVAFEKKENGYLLHLPEFKGELLPIARVFRLQ